jgi:predicted kinase
MKKNKRIFLLCGCPGSGKSTYVRERIAKYGGYHISRDATRFELLDKYGGDYFDHEDEVISTFRNRINELVNSDAENIDIYVDATHLTRAARLNVLNKTDARKAYTIAVWMDVPLELCEHRNAKRTGRECVPTKTLRDMYNRYSKPSKYDFDEVWRVDADGVTHK